MAVTTAGDGFFAGVAPCGTALSKRHLTALDSVADLRSTGALVAFDADPAGQRAAVRAYHLLCQLTDKDRGSRASSLARTQPRSRRMRGRTLYDLLARRTHPLADVVIDQRTSTAGTMAEIRRRTGQRPARDRHLIAAMPPATSAGRSPASPSASA